MISTLTLTARTNSDVGFWNRKKEINFARWIWLDTNSNDRSNRLICFIKEGGKGSIGYVYLWLVLILFLVGRK